jgi:hypothetical protein
MQAELESVAEEIKAMLAEYEQSKAEAKAAKQAKNKEKAKAASK